MCLMPYCPDCQRGLIREYNLEKKVNALEQQLATFQAALRESTELLRNLKRPTPLHMLEIVNNQIAANEAVLGGGE